MNNPLKQMLDNIRDTLASQDVTIERYPHAMFGRTTVYDTLDPAGFPLRVLDVQGTWQSATYLDEDWAKLVFPYHCLYNDAIRENLEPRRALMLGGGGYSYPKYLLAYEPECSVDVVEIDPLMTQIAKQYFLLDHLDQLCGGANAGGRLRSFATDGRSFLAQAAEKSYDYIFNDCFAATDPARDLMTVEAARAIHRALVEGGSYATNVVSALEGPESQLLRDVVASLEQVFSHVFVVPCDEGDPDTPDNNVVIATDAPWEHYDPYVLSSSPKGHIIFD